MYAILQIVNLWSPNPIQYNLVSYKPFEESPTKCSAAVERGAPLPGCGISWEPWASPSLPPTRLARALTQLWLIQLEPHTLILAADPEPQLLRAKCLEIPGHVGPRGY